MLKDDKLLHENYRIALKNLYWFASDDQGIRHGPKSIPTLDYEDAKFILVTCSAFINYLTQKAEKAGISLEI